jgi:hypothetical protein
VLQQFGINQTSQQTRYPDEAKHEEVLLVSLSSLNKHYLNIQTLDNFHYFYYYNVVSFAVFLPLPSETAP